MKIFEDEVMEIQADMVALGLEYVQGQAEKIYIYGIADSLFSFNMFFQINGSVIKLHKVNDVLTNKVEVSDDIMFSLLDYGLDDMNKIINLFDDNNLEHPTELWLTYDVASNSLDIKYSYDGRYGKDEELLPRLEFEKWFEEIKASSF